MKELDSQKLFVQYRDIMKPYEPIKDRKYTITHSDITKDLFVFVSENYAEDQITKLRDEVRVAWGHYNKELALVGYVTVDTNDIVGNSYVRYNTFYKEMPVALQALRQADRFLFEKHPNLDIASVYIRFISNNLVYNKTFDFGAIGTYKIN